MKTLMQIASCVLIGGIFGGSFGFDGSVLGTAIYAAFGIAFMLVLYTVSYIIVCISKRISTGCILISPRTYLVMYDDFFYGKNPFKNQAYRIDENGEPNIDPLWLLRDEK